jgi:hypothetical protein
MYQVPVYIGPIQVGTISTILKYSNTRKSGGELS